MKKQNEWKMKMTLLCDRPVIRAKNLYERLNPKEKQAFQFYYKWSKLLFG
ncbi:MAG: hypothetical protein UT24_C0016G0040 [Candidatus Woesebacteria bacterium GW2011_GWB1_39_12]|uniref:Uncharacterized protein n=1 Tax=Candidatus Woesebacteria bacterium GW2011_GWB1_39_12 TaxID=1618574 RepID=A0A0G0MII2_9BACT|nr:MAG: hypothetical protein UT24_C0016G0040 [Candidatus Woesebacteria bacterium GW2011_GWB1_39_12]